MAFASRLAVLLMLSVIGLSACATERPRVPSAESSGEPPRQGSATTPSRPSPSKPATGGGQSAASRPGTLPDSFESPDFLVVFAHSGDSAESLAARHLGDPGKAWVIEDYAGRGTFPEGQEVVIPRRALNPVGVYPSGYQLVPVLVYHNIGPERKGRLTIAARTFEEQMRYLKAEGFHAVSLAEFLEFSAGRRQVPRKSVLLAFDDGYRSFLQFARPLLKELGFRATLFVYSDFVGGGAALTWHDLADLAGEGFDVQAHSKTHADLRRRATESDADYARRMESELGLPAALFRRHLGRASATVAYPYGAADEELIQRVTQYGYVAAFTVRREANPAFAFPRALSRAQIYSDMTLQTFARNLTVFHDEPLDRVLADDSPQPAAVTEPIDRSPSPRRRLAASHDERSEAFERQGHLRQALDERAIALTIDPKDAAATAAEARLSSRIERKTGALVEEGKKLLARGLQGEARHRLLAALALNPTNRAAFETLQNEVRQVAFIVHTVRAGDTLASVADLYYGEEQRADVIADTNGLAVGARLPVGRTLRIPEIPGVPFLPR